MDIPCKYPRGNFKGENLVIQNFSGGKMTIKFDIYFPFITGDLQEKLIISPTFPLRKQEEKYQVSPAYFLTYPLYEYNRIFQNFPCISV